MWNGKLVLTTFLGSLWALTLQLPAAAVRSQNYSPEQFISVLNGLGYPVPLGVSASSPKLQQSIRDFQLQQRLPIDGVLNARTQDQAADLVRTLQEKLNRVVRPNPQLPLSQFYGKQTELAVRSFQQQNQLPPTGIATPETQQRLEDILSDALPRSTPTPLPLSPRRSLLPPPSPVFPASPTVLPSSTPQPLPSNPGSFPRSDSSSPTLSSLRRFSGNPPLGLYTPNQLRSILIGFGYPIASEASLNDAALVSAVRDFQTTYGLTVTGQADVVTQQAMASVVRSLRNSLRIALQGNLPVTPFYDAFTTAAVRRFQNRYRLPKTGIADLQMRNLIDQTAKGTKRKG